MKTKLTLFALCAVALLTGCTSSYQLNNTISAPNKLKPGISGYVAIPAAGKFESEEYPSSGNQTAHALAQALKPHLGKMYLATDVVSVDQNLADALKNGADFLFLPRILHWENRATEWSGMNDRIHIELRTIHVQTGETLDIGDFRGVSKWMTLGGDVPEELLAKPMGQYVNYLFGETLPKSARIKTPAGPKK